MIKPVENSTAEATAGGTRPGAGAPAGNRNATRHGLRSALVIGSLPKGASYVRRLVGQFRRALEASLQDSGRALGTVENMHVSGATRAETRALLAFRWLQHEGDKLPLSERLALLREIDNATETRNRHVSKLGLGDTDSSPGSDLWSVLDNPPTEPKP